MRFTRIYGFIFYNSEVISIDSIDNTVSNLFKGLNNPDSPNSASIGISSLSGSTTDSNDPYSFWYTLITTVGNNTNYKQQLALPWAFGQSNTIAYRVLDNNTWRAWTYLPDKNWYNFVNTGDNITFVYDSSKISTNGNQFCLIIGNICYIHLCFWFKIDPGIAAATPVNLATLPSGYTYSIQYNMATNIEVSGSGSAGRVAVLNWNGTYLTLSSPSLFYKDDHIEFNVIGRATKT